MRSVSQVEAGGAVLSEAVPEEARAPVSPRTPFRAYRLLALFLVLRPLGNVCLAWGMKHFTQVLSANPFIYLRAMLNPFVALGIAALVLGLLTRMALLSLADLSFVLPLTATGYIFSTLLGKFFLAEQVTFGGWLGTVLIFLGTALVSSTSQRTSHAMKAHEPTS
jgi:drug/metabolite transporter (DMT)-like permease